LATSLPLSAATAGRARAAFEAVKRAGFVAQFMR
jgi:hypothetical protein